MLLLQLIYQFFPYAFMRRLIAKRMTKELKRIVDDMNPANDCPYEDCLERLLIIMSTASFNINYPLSVLNQVSVNLATRNSVGLLDSIRDETHSLDIFKAARSESYYLNWLANEESLGEIFWLFQSRLAAGILYRKFIYDSFRYNEIELLSDVVNNERLCNYVNDQKFKVLVLDLIELLNTALALNKEESA